jgi:PleD family two-component response regulator
VPTQRPARWELPLCILQESAAPTRFKVYEISATDNPAVSTVLVVDDEPIVRDVVVRYLERDGYRTLEAGSGDEARLLLEREPVGCINSIVPAGTGVLAA